MYNPVESLKYLAKTLCLDRLVCRKGDFSDEFLNIEVEASDDELSQKISSLDPNKLPDGLNEIRSYLAQLEKDDVFYFNIIAQLTVVSNFNDWNEQSKLDLAAILVEATKNHDDYYNIALCLFDIPGIEWHINNIETFDMLLMMLYSWSDNDIERDTDLEYNDNDLTIENLKIHDDLIDDSDTTTSYDASDDEWYSDTQSTYIGPGQDLDDQVNTKEINIKNIYEKMYDLLIKLPSDNYDQVAWGRLLCEPFLTRIFKRLRKEIIEKNQEGEEDSLYKIQGINKKLEQHIEELVYNHQWEDVKTIFADNDLVGKEFRKAIYQKVTHKDLSLSVDEWGVIIDITEGMTNKPSVLSRDTLNMVRQIVDDQSIKLDQMPAVIMIYEGLFERKDAIQSSTKPLGLYKENLNKIHDSLQSVSAEDKTMWQYLEKGLKTYADIQVDDLEKIKYQYKRIKPYLDHNEDLQVLSESDKARYLWESVNQGCVGQGHVKKDIQEYLKVCESRQKIIDDLESPTLDNLIKFITDPKNKSFLEDLRVPEDALSLVEKDSHFINQLLQSRSDLMKQLMSKELLLDEWLMISESLEGVTPIFNHTLISSIIMTIADQIEFKKHKISGEQLIDFALMYKGSLREDIEDKGPSKIQQENKEFSQNIKRIAISLGYSEEDIERWAMHKDLSSKMSQRGHRKINFNDVIKEKKRIDEQFNKISTNKELINDNKNEIYQELIRLTSYDGNDVTIRSAVPQLICVRTLDRIPCLLGVKTEFDYTIKETFTYLWLNSKYWHVEIDGVEPKIKGQLGIITLPKKIQKLMSEQHLRSQNKYKSRLKLMGIPNGLNILIGLLVLSSITLVTLIPLAILSTFTSLILVGYSVVMTGILLYQRNKIKKSCFLSDNQWRSWFKLFSYSKDKVKVSEGRANIDQDLVDETLLEFFEEYDLYPQTKGELLKKALSKSNSKGIQDEKLGFGGYIHHDELMDDTIHPYIRHVLTLKPFEKEHDKTIKNLKDKKKIYEQKNQTCLTDIEQFKQKIEDAEKEIEANNKVLENIETQITQLKDNIKDAEKEIEENNKVLANIETQIIQLNENPVTNMTFQQCLRDGVFLERDLLKRLQEELPEDMINEYIDRELSYNTFKAGDEISKITFKRLVDEIDPSHTLSHLESMNIDQWGQLCIASLESDDPKLIKFTLRKEIMNIDDILALLSSPETKLDERALKNLKKIIELDEQPRNYNHIKKLIAKMVRQDESDPTDLLRLKALLSEFEIIAESDFYPSVRNNKNYISQSQWDVICLLLNSGIKPPENWQKTIAQEANKRFQKESVIECLTAMNDVDDLIEKVKTNVKIVDDNVDTMKVWLDKENVEVDENYNLKVGLSYASLPMGMQNIIQKFREESLKKQRSDVISGLMFALPLLIAGISMIGFSALGLASVLVVAINPFFLLGLGIAALSLAALSIGQYSKGMWKLNKKDDIKFLKHINNHDINQLLAFKKGDKPIEQMVVDYTLTLDVDQLKNLKKPNGTRLMRRCFELDDKKALNNIIVSSIKQGKLDEILDGFESLDQIKPMFFEEYYSDVDPSQYIKEILSSDKEMRLSQKVKMKSVILGSEIEDQLIVEKIEIKEGDSEKIKENKFTCVEFLVESGNVQVLNCLGIQKLAISSKDYCNRIQKVLTQLIENHSDGTIKDNARELKSYLTKLRKRHSNDKIKHNAEKSKDMLTTNPVSRREEVDPIRAVDLGTQLEGKSVATNNSDDKKNDSNDPQTSSKKRR